MPTTKVRPYYADRRYWYEDHSYGQVDGPYQIGTYQLIGDNQVTLGDSVPEWRRLIATGENATTSLDGTEYVRTVEPASCDYGAQHKDIPAVSHRYRYKLYGNMMSYFLGAVSTDLVEASSYVDRADSQARSRFYQRLAEVQTSFKGAVFTGELAETLRMIRNPARAFRRHLGTYLDDVKKRGPRIKPRYRPKFVRDSWLEYSFGWQPLINDLEDGIVALYKSKWVRPVFKMVRSRGSYGAEPVSGPSQAVSAGVPSIILRWNVEYSAKADVRYYGVFHSRGNGPSAFKHFGFRPAEFIPTLWELVPYSFLVDYFTNIGEILSSWSYRNIGCSWASRGQKLYNRAEIRNAEIVFLDTQTYTITHNSGSPGSSSFEYASRSRTPSVSIPLPDFHLQVPGMGVKWINLAALSKQISLTRRSLAS